MMSMIHDVGYVMDFTKTYDLRVKVPDGNVYCSKSNYTNGHGQKRDKNVAC